MADKDRSKFLLSAEALPKVVIPKASEHRLREFRLPGALESGLASKPASARPLEPADARPAQPSATPAPVIAGPADPAAGAASAETSTSPEASAGERADERRADSTLRFKDRTLGWFRAGDDLEDEQESVEYEVEAPSRRRAIALAAAIAALLVAVAIAIWQLS